MQDSTSNHDSFDTEFEKDALCKKSKEISPSFIFFPEKSLRDSKYIAFLAFTLFIVVVISLYGFYNGDPERHFYETDSWGNVCGRKNNQLISGVPLSGLDHSNRTFVFQMGTNNIRAGLKPTIYLYSDPYYSSAIICVHKCPKSEITDCRELLKDNGYNLRDKFISEHVCIMLLDMIFPHTIEFNRCIPTKLLQVRVSRKRT